MKEPKLSTRLAKYLFGAVFGITFLFLLWLSFLQLVGGVNYHSTKVLLLTFLILVTLVALYLARKTSFCQKLFSVKSLRLILLISIVLGVGARLSFLSLSENYLPNGSTSDTGIHWYAGQEILASGQIQSADLGIYEAYFPYLTTYTMFVSAMMKIFGVNYAAILLPNILADLLAGLILYFLLKHWRGEKAALIGASIWIVNPLGIAFSVQSLALSLTNLLIVAAIALVYCLWRALQKSDSERALLLAAILGLTLSVGNNIRGVFAIFLIALIIMLVIRSFWRHTLADNILHFSVIILTAACYICTNAVMTIWHYSVNPYYTETHGTLGWSVYVGAHYGSQGRWSFEDWETMPPRLYGGEMSPAEINSTYLREGIARYREMSLVRLGTHLMNKSERLFMSNEVTLVRNLEEQFTNVDGSESWYWVLNDLSYLTLSLLVVGSLVSFWQVLWRTKTWLQDSFLLFLALSFCGLLVSSLMVEVMSRYVAVFLALLVIFTTCALVQAPEQKQIT